MMDKAVITGLSDPARGVTTRRTHQFKDNGCMEAIINYKYSIKTRTYMIS